ncbi:LysR substrate-binding domain-containing protein [Rhizobium sp. TRM96647]|uniref:LysR substrate-binding domain-containing protein n=1 Tax=unclassified Rhizobium TaxID=2613769 RepID=UPI001E51E842|nr:MULTISPECIES: LysR substrate-binding domain-containing protein [unclassified Rhizobium]MCD2184602.1 LysR substrate-binding domain-containing protein [Rhizobium sp. GN54]MCV3739140.1 LysR substrate-binding domain-containing protein [Rhizobium sp. TRM96647]MCV3760855.1 LysR substrate-binding domain-containing protein [Rhizobium sp. TRM96650]
MRHIVNFQTDLLRTFVSVIDLGAFTKAGEALGRTQPAISLQIRRLEELVGAPIIKQVGRTLLLTSEGEMLLSYAREILRMNDEAASYFNRAKIAGVIRVGLPNDYAVAFLQGVITEYTRQNPEISLELHCGWSAEILDRLRADELDIAIAMVNGESTQYLSRSWVERPVWAAVEDIRFDRAQGIPLAAHPEGCAYRSRMIQALDAANIRWRVAYTGSGIAGLQNAVVNGLGVSALTRYTMLPGMRILDEKDGFPPLAEIRVGLFYKHPRLSDAGIRLVNHAIARLDEAGVSGDPTRAHVELVRQ